MYHVFLSHSSQDKPAVEQIARRLREEGDLSPFLDKWHLVPGMPWQPALEQALAKSETVAVFFGPSGLGPWHHEEMRVALQRAVQSRDECRIIPVLLPGSSQQQITGFLGQRMWVDFREGLDSSAAFSRLVAGILGKPPEDDAFSLPDEPAPYRGLLAFDEAHSQFFFGREPDIERVLDKLRVENFVAVVGASGAGKSSLVLGGVLARLKQPQGPGPKPRSFVLRPGAQPLRALADQLATLVPVEHRMREADSQHERLRQRSDGLRTALATLTASSPSPLILVVDQFEELFTHALRQDGSSEIKPFLDNLYDTVKRANGVVRVLITLRADFFDRCLGYASLKELLEDQQVLLGSLGDEALRDIITRPAQLVGAYLEKGLMSAILRDASREPGALPLLEDALYQLWCKRSGAWLTLSAYESSGGISKALERRAQECYGKLKPQEQEIARRVFVRLASLGEGREDTRRRVARGELSFPGMDDAEVEQVLQGLSGPEARLLVMAEGTIEVSHEILIRTWPLLRGWLDEDRRALQLQRRLAEAASEWREKSHDESFLYRGARLVDIEGVLAYNPTLLNQQEREFLEESIRLREKQEREEEEQRKRELEAARRLAEEMQARLKSEAQSASRARRSAWILGGLALGLLAAGMALAALFQRSERERQIAFSRELATSALLNAKEDPQRMLLLLQEAQRLAPVDQLGSLLDAWTREPCRAVLRGHTGTVSHAVFSPDGTRVLTASEDGTARLWDTASGKPLSTLEGHSKGVRVAAFSPEGSRVLTASEDGTARLWDTASGKPLSTLAGHSLPVTVAAFSPDGTRVLTASMDGTARLWDTASGKPLSTLEGHSKGVRVAAFSPEGSRVLTVSKDGTARLWPNWRWEPESFANLNVGRQLTCEERQTYLHEDVECPKPNAPSTSDSPPKAISQPVP